MLAVATLLLFQSSATIKFLSDGTPRTLTLKVGKKTYKAEPYRFKTVGQRLAEYVHVGGTVICARGTKIYNRASGKFVDTYPVSRTLFPKTPGKYDNSLLLRSKGGLSLGNRAFWLYSWDSFDASMEPSTDVFAMEISIEPDGTPRVLRSTPILTYAQHPRFCSVRKVGSLLLMGGYGAGVFDFEVWKEIAFQRGYTGVFSESGQLYYYNYNGIRGRFNTRSRQFGNISSSLTGSIYFIFPTANDDLVFTSAGILLARTGAFYQFGGTNGSGFTGTLYDIPNVAIAFLSNAFPRDTPGIVLSEKFLTPITVIHRSDK